MSLRERGIRLLAAGDRIELATAPEAGALVARYVGADAVRLSPAGLETLAIVAYRQPVTRAAVERIRGVDSDHTLRSLLHRRLVVELGRSGAPGRPILYGTAFEFLERFGLESLDDLPPLDADVAARLAEEGGALLLPLDETTRRSEAEPRRRTRSAWPDPVPEERIQKVLAAAGVASRRAAEELVAAGRVRVDGRPATIGQKVDPAVATIEVDGTPVGIGVARAYVALHKPAGVTSTTRDRHAETTVLDLIPTALVAGRDAAVPGRAPRPGFRGAAPADQRRRLGGARPPPALRRRARVRGRRSREPLTGDQARALNAGIRLDEGMARLAQPLRTATRGRRPASSPQTLDPPP